MSECPFCCLDSERILESNERALTVLDAFPVAVGHTLIIPRRHVSSFFDLTNDEVTAIHDLLRQAKIRLDATLQAGGYNIGINIGATAGQTVEHAHAHLIPRYEGDVENPVGGVRNIIPGRGDYRSMNAGHGRTC